MNVFCPNCGSAIESQPGAQVTCPTCKTQFTAPGAAVVEPRVITPPPSEPIPFPSAPRHETVVPVSSAQQTNPLAVVSLVSAILCCIPLSGVAAVITGVIAIKQIDQNPQTQTGKNLAIAGIALGGVSIMLAIVGGIFRGILRTH